MKTITVKIYLNREQEKKISDWMFLCCLVYNRALEHRIKSYKRRGESVSLFDQHRIISKWRCGEARLKSVPIEFEYDAARRVDRGFKAFYRRVKKKETPGFPRFRPAKRYNSLEQMVSRECFTSPGKIFVPKIGEVSYRGVPVAGKTKGIRILRRPSGWYAQVIVDVCDPLAPATKTLNCIGIDVGIESLATLSNGEKAINHRWMKKSAARVRHASRALSRRKYGSRNRIKARKRLARIHERVASQRRSFCHQVSTALVKKYDFIAVEKLNIKGLARTRMAKSVMDVGWGILLRQIAYKAESAGKTVVAVSPRYTSQECPVCGVIKKKSLSERVHRCPCGCEMDRDHAAAQVILSRALEHTGANACGGDIRPELALAGSGSPNETGRPSNGYVLDFWAMKAPVAI